MTASKTARPRRPPKPSSRASSRQASARSRRGSGRSRDAGRKANVKRNAAATARGPELADASVDGPRLGRLRALLARRGRSTTKHSAPRTQIRDDEPREWPRRLALAGAKLGVTVAVAWGLLIAGREVYEYATTSARFEVQHLIYEPSAHVDDDTLRELLAIQPGTNILACDLAELSERVATHPWVSMAIVTRNLPDTLSIELIEHEPAAMLLAGRFYLVNDEGQPFKLVERGERGELPIITGVERDAFAGGEGQPIAALVTALDIIRLYQTKQRPRLGELHLGDDGSITLYTAASGTALLLGRDEFEARLERWDALRAALGERADRLAVVHLDHESKPDRRDRVVARFANERDDVVLLAQAATASEPEAERGAGERAGANKPKPKPPALEAGKRNRIPRYE